MSLIITCECGYVIRGESEEQLVGRAREHLGANHPAVEPNASDADFLDMAIVDDDEAANDRPTTSQ